MTHAAANEPRKLTANVKAAGCAAKLSSSELEAILRTIPKPVCPELLAGIDNFEDGAVYKITEALAIIQTIDFFPPLVDDPFLYGRIAAANALSDVYAMGGRPILALNVLCFPTCDYPLSVVEEILKGGASQVSEAGAVLAGGHSIQMSEPVYGLSVTGLVDPAEMLTNSGARSGDRVVLCKPLGTGICLLGMKAKELPETAERALLASLSMLNKRHLEIARRHKPRGATDVTGFGLAGHLHEMAKASGLSVRIEAKALPVLPQALELAEMGFVPAGAYGNRKSFEPFVSYINDVDLPISDLLFDPQTSGGLLFAVPPGESAAFCADLEKAGLTGSCIGEFHDDTGKEVVDGTAGSIGIVEVA